MKREVGKRGISGVVTAILLILLAIAAVIIVWVVVKNIIGTSSPDISVITSDVKIISIDIDEDTNLAEINLQRLAGKGEVAGVKFAFYNDSGESFIKDDKNILNELETRTYNIDLTGKISNVNKVDISLILKVNELEKISPVKSGAEKVNGAWKISYGGGGGGGGGGSVPGCTPDCSGKSCGQVDSKCGTKCTACSIAGEVCNTQTWTCEASCVLDSASWSTSLAVDGDLVALRVTGTNCDGKTVSFKVWEDDGLFPDDEVILNNPPDNALFINGVASIDWDAEWHEDTDGLTSDPEYVFIASVGGESIESGIMDVSQSVGAICGNGECESGENNINCPDDCSTDAGLLAYYKFENSVLDETGNYPGTNNGATFTAGKIGSAASFDGINDYVKIGDDDSFKSLSKGTIAGWFKSDLAKANFLFGVGNKTACNGGAIFWIYIKTDGSINIMQRNIDTNNNLLANTPASTIIANNWYHIAWVVDLSGNKLYINGVKQKLTYSTSSASNYDFFDDIAQTQNYWIGGAKYTSTGPVNRFGYGLFDEFKIWNRALSGSEVAAEFNNAVCDNDDVCDFGEIYDNCPNDCLPCTLTSASWRASSIEERKDVSLTVTGTGSNCNGKTISFEVWEDDGIWGRNPVQNNPHNAVISGNTATTTWTAEWQSDISGNPEYYFVASLASTPSSEITSANPELEVSQCVPICAGKECGDNGCGGFCAPGCGSGESCVSGACEPTVTTNWWSTNYAFRIPININIPADGGMHYIKLPFDNYLYDDQALDYNQIKVVEVDNAGNFVKEETNLQIKGLNLLQNPGFENGLIGWRVQEGGGSYYVSIDSSNQYTTPNSAKSTRPTSYIKQTVNLAQTLPPRTRYIFGGAMKTANVREKAGHQEADAGIYLELYNTNGILVRDPATPIYSPGISMTNDWKMYYNTKPKGLENFTYAELFNQRAIQTFDNVNKLVLTFKARGNDNLEEGSPYYYSWGDDFFLVVDKYLIIDSSKVSGNKKYQLYYNLKNATYWNNNDHDKISLTSSVSGTELSYTNSAPEYLFDEAKYNEDYVVFEDEGTFQLIPNFTLPSSTQLASSFYLQATPGEYEPVSFGIYSLKDINDLKVEVVGDFGGAIDKEDIDLRIVKWWTQRMKVWEGGVLYRTEGFAFVPELLMEDDRIELYSPYPDNPYTCDNLPDVPELGYTITDAKKDTSKSYFLTIKVPAGLAAGTYSDKIRISASGYQAKEIPIKVEVLPFTLDETSRFLVMYNHFMPEDDGECYSEERTRNMQKDILEHGFNIGRSCDSWNCDDMVDEVGFKGILAGGLLFTSDATEETLVQDCLRIKNSLAENNFEEVWVYGVDEATSEGRAAWERMAYRACNSVGMRVAAAIRKQDMDNLYGTPETEGYNMPLYEMDGYPHGDITRYIEDLILGEAEKKYEYEGLYFQSYLDGPDGYSLPYRQLFGYFFWNSKLDTLAPYTYQKYMGSPRSPYDDCGKTGCVNKVDERDLMMTYPTQQGILSTVKWEAIREGIDDLKYVETLTNLIEAKKASHPSEAANVESQLNEEMKQYQYWKSPTMAYWFWGNGWQWQPHNHMDLEVTREKIVNWIIYLRGL